MQWYTPKPLNRHWCAKLVEFFFKVNWPDPETSQVDFQSHQYEASFSSVGQCHRSPSWKCPPGRAQTCYLPHKQHKVYILQYNEKMSLFYIVCAGGHVWLPVLVFLQQHLLGAAVGSKHRHEDQGVCSRVLDISCYYRHLINYLTWKYETFYSLFFFTCSHRQYYL